MENLTREQSEALEKAAALVLGAQKEAKVKARAMLKQAGIPDDEEWFGNRCTAHIEGHHQCPCSDYTDPGDGGPCLTRVSIDPEFPPHRTCGHKASKHLHA